MKKSQTRQEEIQTIKETKRLLLISILGSLVLAFVGISDEILVSFLYTVVAFVSLIGYFYLKGYERYLERGDFNVKIS